MSSAWTDVTHRMRRPETRPLISDGVPSATITLVDHDDAIGKSVGLLQIVSGEKHRSSVRTYARICFQNARRTSTSKPSVGSSRSKELRIAAQSEREENSLALAARQLTELSILDSIQSAKVHHFVHRRAATGSSCGTDRCARERAGFRNFADLKHRSDTLAVCGPCVDRRRTE